MKHSVLRGTVRGIFNLFLSILEVVTSTMYLLLPVGVYMALLQFREKASKVSSLGTFTEDDSTWQFVHGNFILVCVNPKAHKNTFKKFVKSTDTFFNKYKALIVLSSILLLLVFVYVGVVVK